MRTHSNVYVAVKWDRSRGLTVGPGGGYRCQPTVEAVRKSRWLQ